MQQDKTNKPDSNQDGNQETGGRRKSTFSSEPHVPVRPKFKIDIGESDADPFEKNEDNVDPFREFLEISEFVGEYKTFIYDNIVLVKVNMSRCTQNDVESFKVMLNKFIANGYQRFVISFFKAQFIDSTFIGNLVLTYKRLISLKGTMVLVVKKGSTLAGEFERLDFNRMINVRYSFMDAINRIKEI